MSTNKVTLSSDNLSASLPYLPWHVLFFIIYMISYGYRLVIGDVLLSQVLQITGYFLAGSVILFVILQYLIGIYKAGVTLLIIAASFFTFGHVYHIYIYAYPYLIPYLPAVYLALTILLIFLTILVRHPLKGFSKNLNIVAAILCVMAVIQFVQFMQTVEARRELEDGYDPLMLSVDTLNPPDTDPLPDIYYLIFDAYPGNSYLASHFGIDNTNFTDALETRDFYVLYDALSNYTSTKASMAATLNLDFVHNIAPPDPDVNYDVLDPYMSNSRVARMFQDAGYHYIHFGNGYTDALPTIADTLIDVTAEGEIVNDYSTVLGGKTSFFDYLTVTTALRILDPTLSANEEGFGIASTYSRVRYLQMMNALENIPLLQEPTFTYFHVMKPHIPVNVDANGDPFRWNEVYSNEVDYLANQEIHFEDQLMHLNQRILETIDHILDVSDVPPIIIIQADHGSVLTRNEITVREINRPLPILSAVYFPDEDYTNLYPDMSPINTFPTVFNQFFGMDYELFDDDERFYLIWHGFSALFFGEIPDGLIEPPYN